MSVKSAGRVGMLACKSMTSVAEGCVWSVQHLTESQGQARKGKERCIFELHREAWHAGLQ